MRKTTNHELELYKLILNPDTENFTTSYVTEFGWINEEEFAVWISYSHIEKFIAGLTKIFGQRLFNDGNFYGNMQSNGICIELCDFLEDSVDMEYIFPKSKYQH